MKYYLARRLIPSFVLSAPDDWDEDRIRTQLVMNDYIGGPLDFEYAPDFELIPCGKHQSAFAIETDCGDAKDSLPIKCTELCDALESEDELIRELRRSIGKVQDNEPSQSSQNDRNEQA